MRSALSTHMIRGYNKAEIQRRINDILQDMGSEDTITISFERKSDHEALVEELTRQGIIL